MKTLPSLIYLFLYWKLNFIYIIVILKLILWLNKSNSDVMKPYLSFSWHLNDVLTLHAFDKQIDLILFSL